MAEPFGSIDLQAVLDRAAEPIFILNSDRRLIFCNRACELATGRTARELLGLFCGYHGPIEGDALRSIAGSLGPPPEVMDGCACTMATMLLQPDGTRVARTIQFIPCHESAALLCVIGVLQPTEPTDVPSGSNESAELHAALLRLRQRLHCRYGFDRFVAVSPAMHRVLDQARAAADTDAAVLLLGEPGTGKQTLARTIHHASARRQRPFVVVDCAVLAADSIDAELFGPSPDSERSAFETRGLMREAAGGTLLLREFSRMPRDTQARLAALVRDGTSSTPRAADRAAAPPRLLATDTTSPAAVLQDERLRPDYFYALSTLTIELPALRERRDDLPMLVQATIEWLNAGSQRQVTGLAPAAWEILRQYDWPGNIAELQEVLAAAHGQCPRHQIQPEHLPLRIQGARGAAFLPPRPDDPRIDLKAFLQKAERRLIELALRKAKGNKSRAAELLSISRNSLYQRMEQLGIE
jgi:DNA-binding NtrC family response regulator